MDSDIWMTWPMEPGSPSWGFPKNSEPFLGVGITRIIVYLGISWGPCFWKLPHGLGYLPSLLQECTVNHVTDPPLRVLGYLPQQKAVWVPGDFGPWKQRGHVWWCCKRGLGAIGGGAGLGQGCRFQGKRKASTTMWLFPKLGAPLMETPKYYHSNYSPKGGGSRLQRSWWK